MKIYTKKGDSGVTTDYRNNKVHKSSRLIAVLGTNDEMSSAIGVAKERVGTPSHVEVAWDLTRIQKDIQDINSQLAGAEKPFDEMGERIAYLEDMIDKYTEKMPKLTKFILPGGMNGGAELHHARTIARRAERELSEYSLSPGAGVSPEIKRYMNRVSDYLFTAARYVQY